MNSDDLLIPIQIGKPGIAPIFCLPGAGANIAYFRALAERLTKDATVYGFQPQGLDGMAPPHEGVEAAASDYVSALKVLRPDQPLQLIGHSFGGWIAFELASQWHARGLTVAPLILLDSDAPHYEDNPPHPYDRIAALECLVEILEQSIETTLGIAEGAFAPLSDTAQLELLRERMIAQKLISFRTPISAITQMFAVFSANVNAKYYPSHPYGNSVCLIQARDGHGAENSSLQAGIAQKWRHHATNLTVTDGPGNHMTMLSDRHADALAAAIRQAGFFS